MLSISFFARLEEDNPGFQIGLERSNIRMIADTGSYSLESQQGEKVRGRPKLRFHLAIVLVIKILLLSLLWHAFIKPYKVSVDAKVMSDRLAGAASASSIPTTPGDPK